MTSIAEHAATDVRARGLSPLWACSAVAFLLVSLVIGVLAGPVDLGVGAVLESAAARLHIPGVSTSLSPTDEAILWEIRVPARRARGARGRDAGGCRCDVPGSVPEPARRSVPARSRRRRRARRDHRDRVPPSGVARAASAADRGVRGRGRRGDADVRGGALCAPRARRGDARSSPASPSPRSSPRGRPSSSSRTRRRCRRSTRGSSGTSRARAGRTSSSCFRTSVSRSS